MGMLLSDKSEYFGEYGKVIYSTWNWNQSRFKKLWDVIIAFSSVLWIPFFVTLTILINFLWGH